MIVITRCVSVIREKLTIKNNFFECFPYMTPVPVFPYIVKYLAVNVIFLLQLLFLEPKETNSVNGFVTNIRLIMKIASVVISNE